MQGTHSPLNELRLRQSVDPTKSAVRTRCGAPRRASGGVSGSKSPRSALLSIWRKRLPPSGADGYYSCGNPLANEISLYLLRCDVFLGREEAQRNEASNSYNEVTSAAPQSARRKKAVRNVALPPLDTNCLDLGWSKLLCMCSASISTKQRVCANFIASGACMLNWHSAACYPFFQPPSLR